MGGTLLNVNSEWRMNILDRHIYVYMDILISIIMSFIILVLIKKIQNKLISPIAFRWGARFIGTGGEFFG